MLNIIYARGTSRQRWLARSSSSIPGKHALYAPALMQRKTTYIELTDVLEVLVKGLDHVVNELEHGQLVDVLVDVDAHDKVQRRVPPVDYFVLSVFKERTLESRVRKGSKNRTLSLSSRSRARLEASTYLVLCAGEALADELALERDALLHAEAIIVLDLS